MDDRDNCMVRAIIHSLGKDIYRTDSKFLKVAAKMIKAQVDKFNAQARR